MKSAFLLLLATLFSSSFSFGQNLDELKWMLGEWEMVDGSAITTESWNVLNDSTFVGKGTTLNGGKVVFQEELRIEQRNGELTYVAILPDKIGYFKLAKSSKQMATFEDPKNDFPSEILYELVSDSLEVTLFGNRNGEDQSMKLQFIKK
jgi:hypothetical protein